MPAHMCPPLPTWAVSAALLSQHNTVHHHTRTATAPHRTHHRKHPAPPTSVWRGWPAAFGCRPQPLPPRPPLQQQDKGWGSQCVHRAGAAAVKKQQPLTQALPNNSCPACAAVATSAIKRVLRWAGPLRTVAQLGRLWLPNPHARRRRQRLRGGGYPRRSASPRPLLLGLRICRRRRGGRRGWGGSLSRRRRLAGSGSGLAALCCCCAALLALRLGHAGIQRLLIIGHVLAGRAQQALAKREGPAGTTHHPLPHELQHASCLQRCTAVPAWLPPAPQLHTLQPS